MHGVVATAECESKDSDAGRRLRRKRKLQRTVLSFFDEVAQWQHERGRHGNRTAWMIENPLKSLAWLQAPLQATMAMEDVGTAVTDACVWEKGRPDSKELIKKGGSKTQTQMDLLRSATMASQGGPPIGGLAQGLGKFRLNLFSSYLHDVIL